MGALISGIHHVTALAKSPEANHRFYTGVLGLRLVKKTVNFDDPSTYHLYYGDGSGSPGTLLTYFPHPMAARGAHGTREIRETVLSIPEGSLGYWTERLGGLGIGFSAGTTLDRDLVRFEDPDGMALSLVESARPERREPVPGSEVPVRHAISGVDSAVIHVEKAGPTVEFLEGVLGFVTLSVCSDRVFLRLGDGSAGRRLEVVEDASAGASRLGAGVVHHVAWRTATDEAQSAVAERVRGAGVGVTPVMDRQYFRSIYFRIPGGVIFEVATDGPGFEVDEARPTLGSALKLPPRLEARRAELEARLSPLGPVP